VPERLIIIVRILFIEKMKKAINLFIVLGILASFILGSLIGLLVDSPRERHSVLSGSAATNA